MCSRVSVSAEAQTSECLIPKPPSEQGFGTKFGHLRSQLQKVQQEHGAFIFRAHLLEFIGVYFEFRVGDLCNSDHGDPPVTLNSKVWRNKHPTCAAPAKMNKENRNEPTSPSPVTSRWKTELR